MFTKLYLYVSLALMAATSLSAATITGTVSYANLATVGTWQVTFDSSNPNVQLTSVSVALPSGYYFDTAAGGAGLGTSLDFSRTSGVTTYSVTPGTGSALDGQSTILLTFTGYTTSSPNFVFVADVDGTVGLTNPCAGKTGVALAVCIASNATAYAQYQAAYLAAETVAAESLANSVVVLTFSAPGLEPATLTTNLGNWATMLAGSIDAPTTGLDGSYTGVMTPEPASLALCGLGLCGLAVWRRRQRR